MNRYKLLIKNVGFRESKSNNIKSIYTCRYCNSFYPRYPSWNRPILDPKEHVNFLKRKLKIYDLKFAAYTFITIHSSNHKNLKYKLYEGEISTQAKNTIFT